MKYGFLCCLLLIAYSSSAQREHLPEVLPNTRGVKEIISYSSCLDCKQVQAREESMHYIFDGNGNITRSFSLQPGIAERRMTWQENLLVHMAEYGDWDYQTTDTDTGLVFTDTWDTALLSTETAYSYNEALLQSVRHFTGGKPSSEISFNYNEKGAPVLILYSSPDIFTTPEPGISPKTPDTGTRRYLYRGDSSIARNYYNGTYTGKTIQISNDKGSVVKELSLDRKGRLIDHSLYRYNEQGLLTELHFEQKQDPKTRVGMESFITVYEYNSKGQRITERYKDAAGNLKLLVELEYRY